MLGIEVLKKCVDVQFLYNGENIIHKSVPNLRFIERQRRQCSFFEVLHRFAITGDAGEPIGKPFDRA